MRFLTILASILILFTVTACDILGSRPGRRERFAYGMDPDGTIPVWVVNGPHKTSAPPLYTKAGLDAPASGLKWIPAIASTDGRILFSDITKGEAVSAYAFVEVFSPAAADGFLTVGFSGRMQVWWNGEAVLDERFSHGIEKDWRRAPIKVRRKRNTCLIRLSRSAGRPWGFTARITDTNDRPFPALAAALPLAKKEEPFGVAEGARPDPLTHAFAFPARTGGSSPAERGIFLLGNGVARAMVRVDDDAGNGLEFDFHDGFLRTGGETFIPEFSRLYVETRSGKFGCTSSQVSRPGGVSIRDEIPGALLQASFVPRGANNAPSRLETTATYFLPPRRNAAVIRVEVFNPRRAPVEDVRLHHSFMTRDNRFVALSEAEDGQIILLEGAQGGRWVALSVRPFLPQETSDAFPLKNGILASTSRRRGKARAGVFYPGKPARNAYIRLTSGVGRLDAGRRVRAYFFIAAGRSRNEAIDTLKNCMRVGGPRLLAESRAEWKKRTKGWATVLTPNAHFNAIFRHSRNALGILPGRAGRLPAGYIDAPAVTRDRDAVLCAIGMTLAGQRTEARELLLRLLLRMSGDKKRTEDAARLLYGLWHYQSFTGDKVFAAKHGAKVAALADGLAAALRTGPDRPPLIFSRVEGTWGRRWLGGGYSLSRNAWAIVGLEKAARLLATNDKTSAERTRPWTEAADKCRKAAFGSGKYSFVRDGRLVKRLKPDGSVQSKGSAVQDGPPMPLGPDLATAVPYLWGAIGPGSAAARKTSETLLALWEGDGKWNFGGASRYNVLSDPDGPSAGPRADASLMLARSLLLQDEYGAARRLIEWVAGEGTFGYTWPGRVSMSAARDRDERYKETVATLPWGEWLNLFLRESAGLRPTPAGLMLRPHLPKGWAGMKVRNVKFRGVTYDIEYIGHGSRIESIRFNGKMLKAGQRILPIKNGKVRVRLVPPGTEKVPKKPTGG